MYFLQCLLFLFSIAHVFANSALYLICVKYAFSFILHAFYSKILVVSVSKQAIKMHNKLQEYDIYSTIIFSVRYLKQYILYHYCLFHSTGFLLSQLPLQQHRVSSVTTASSVARGFFCYNCLFNSTWFLLSQYLKVLQSRTFSASLRCKHQLRSR